MKFVYLAPLVAAVGVPVLAQERGQAGQPGGRDDSIIVRGTPQDRYDVDNVDQLTGISLHFLELPRVVETIPEQVLLDQKVTELDEALRNVPGVSLGDGFGGSNNDFYIRGFRRNTVYRDGLRTASNFRVNTTNLQAVRVIKGPASITYGQVEPGGLVDIITKKPLDEQRIYAEARLGSYDSSLLLLDWSQPLGDKAAIRINAATEDSDSFRDLFDISRDTVSLTGRYDFTNRTRLNLSYEYRDEFRTFDRGTITVPTPGGREIVNRLLDIPISRRFGEAYEQFDTQVQFATADLTHEFNDRWSIRVAGAWEHSRSDDLQSRPGFVQIFDENAPIQDGFFTGPATPKDVFDAPTDQVFLIRRTDGSQDHKQTSWYINAQINGEFLTGGIRHRVALGGNWRSFRSSRFFGASAITNGVPVADGGGGPLFDIQNPVYGTLPDEVSIAGLSPIIDKTVDYGAFLNDYIDITSRLSLLLGGRVDFSDVDRGGPAKTVSEFSPQLALTYDVAANVSAFVSYAEAFQPNTAFILDPSGAPSTSELFDPEDSRQYEAGLKARLLSGNLNVQGSIYKIEKTNVLSVVDGVPQLTDGQESKGFEISANGQPLPGLNIWAGYAYTDAEILTGADSGNRPTNVAKHTFNLWMSYEQKAGTLRGLGAGAGAFYMADRYGDDANSWTLGDYMLVDGSVWYNLPLGLFERSNNVRLQLSVKNILDEEYYPASGGDLRVSIGAPRTVFGSVAVTF
ncbi:TonB-dependent siderophore receptor [Novosphingobium sp. PC22D]|uniref:TonB-dependent siderophore receptor n=1 Tax=Novosphingobium sp. PC22D TaxID=1962403 RepID=UPI000BF02486|nr:TonB-dependent siderophore receptor [Novosphingobium sp. PC22D]PEQ10459.1 TonB-dependent siderophore receptor [Novosphingobium sp. PC22D]